jgi:hypothetical protein
MASPVNRRRPEIGEYRTRTAGCSQHEAPPARRVPTLLVAIAQL